MNAAADRDLADLAVNEVRLIGRISQAPEERVLLGGGIVVTFRVVVPRASTRNVTRQTVDALDCQVRRGPTAKRVMGWHADDVVEVSGSIRRVFMRARGAVFSRVTVDVTKGKVVKAAVTSSQ